MKAFASSSLVLGIGWARMWLSRMGTSGLSLGAFRLFSKPFDLA